MLVIILFGTFLQHTEELFSSYFFFLYNISKIYPGIPLRNNLNSYFYCFPEVSIFCMLFFFIYFNTFIIRSFHEILTRISMCHTGQLTRIRSAINPLKCWKIYSDQCGASISELQIYFSYYCTVTSSIFAYDKITGLLYHACSGRKACMRDWSDWRIVVSPVCTDDPEWFTHNSNTRFTRTSCKY